MVSSVLYDLDAILPRALFSYHILIDLRLFVYCQWSHSGRKYIYKKKQLQHVCFFFLHIVSLILTYCGCS